MQIAWPEEPNVLFEALLGKWAPDGVMDADIYLALVQYTVPSWYSLY